MGRNWAKELGAEFTAQAYREVAAEHMDKLIRKVDEVLRSKFAGATTELDLMGDRAHGFLLWEGFDGEEQVDRQQKLWKVLRAHFGSHVYEKIAAIFTLTPEEIALIREETAHANKN